MKNGHNVWIITNKIEDESYYKPVFYKNLEVVIRAIGILKKTQPGVKLVIVGDGYVKEQMRYFTESEGK